MYYNMSKTEEYPMKKNEPTAITLPGMMLTTGLSRPVSAIPSPDRDLSRLRDNLLHKKTTFILCFHLRRA
jgi:hypothetical protein